MGFAIQQHELATGISHTAFKTPPLNSIREFGCFEHELYPFPLLGALQ